MKLEYLKIDASAYPHADPNQLIRLYDFDSGEIASLKKAILSDVIDRAGKLSLSELAFVQTVNCTLVLQKSDDDLGLVLESEDQYICLLTSNLFQKMVYLLEPFCEDADCGYQWLYDLDTPIDLLLSKGGGW